MKILPETTAGDHEVRLCGPEDVVNGSSSQHLPHGLIDDLLIVATANRHGAQEAYNKYLLQEGICGNVQTCQQNKHKDYKQKKHRKVNSRYTHKIC